MTVIISGDNGVSDVDGSAGTPAIRGTDANTGIFFGADQVGVATNGVERVEFGNSETVFNDGGANVDFRVEGDTDANLLFVDASADRLGVGTSSPSAKLHVVGGQSYVTGASGAGAYSRWYNNGNTSDDFQVGQGFATASDNIALMLNNANAAMVFGTNGTERARIDSSGNLGVGTTTPATPNNGGICLNPSATSSSIQVTGSSTSNDNNGFLLYSTGSSSYRFYVGYGGTISAVSTSISSLSDQSLKENIVDLQTGLTQVMSLKPRKFDWKDGEGTGEKNVDGFIAQEVQEVMPNLVTQYQYNKTETKLGIKMGDLVPTLVKAIQELKAINDAQASRIETLEAKVAALEAK
jgi:hypothetical protein